jgi:hypothetical protein
MLFISPCIDHDKQNLPEIQQIVLVSACRKIKKKRINRIDALNIFVNSESVNYFLEDIKDAGSHVPYTCISI